MKTSTTLLALLLLMSPVLRAEDVWVLRGGVGQECGLTRWEADTLFLNTGAASSTVRVLGVSDGPDQIGDRVWTVAPARVFSITRTPAAAWRPMSAVPIWFLHLDVPPEVTIESILNVGAGDCTLSPGVDRSAQDGSIHLPVFRSLVPAGRPQTFLGTDLGLIRARTNVGLYNAGSETAVADVQLIRGCDSQALARVTLTLAPNTSRQISLQAPVLPACTAATQQDVQDWVNYVVVTVSQPSLSYVSSITNEGAPRVLLSIR